ncbi:MAG: hypothetical protein LBJ41_00790 [Treponema sp.]|nr:hypothetical protein [Treponema sp.]
METVKELAPAVSDEFPGRLEVIASGRAGLRRFTDKLGKSAKIVDKGLFKG